MLIEPKLNLFKELTSHASTDELIWMNGFLSGLLSAKSSGNKILQKQAVPASSKLSVIYATETGNAKRLATTFAAKGKKAGLKIKLYSAETYKPESMAEEEFLIIVISTQGDGEPPLSAAQFYRTLHDSDLKLPKLKFGVLALGDSSYPLFCQAGIEVDKQLALRGAERAFPLIKCDTDYESDAVGWFDNVINYLKSAGCEPLTTAVQNKSTGKKIYDGAITENIILNDEGSQKQTHHIEISVGNMTYQPGDAIGIIPKNNDDAVQEILKIVSVNGKEKIVWRNHKLDIYEVLRSKVQIAYLPERVIKKYTQIISTPDMPETRMGLVDLLKIYPVKNQEEFIRVLEILEPVAPRLYSVSSSPEATSGEVHITVALDTFYVDGKKNYGHCSGYLAGLPIGTNLSFYVHANKMFRLPENHKDIIMIGPGTGIAPFRSFLFERDAKGAEGRSWLFFGEQHFTTDFLYQAEIQTFLDTGVLTRFNGAFSRDQEHKIYVQHKMLQHGKELFEWIENGAHVYICGAREPMSADVEDALLLIISEQKKTGKDEAKNYLRKITEEGRYHKDVY